MTDGDDRTGVTVALRLLQTIVIVVVVVVGLFMLASRIWTDGADQVMTPPSSEPAEQ